MMVPLPKKLGAQFGIFLRGCFEAVQAFQNAFANILSCRHRGHGQRLIGDGQVIEDRFLIDVHALDAILNDDGDFVGERGIVSQAG